MALQPGVFKITPVKKKFEMHLYLHQVTSGADTNQKVVVNPGGGSEFGVMAVNDWTFKDSLGPNAKLVARAQGLHTNAKVSGEHRAWFATYNMVFVDDRFKGSQLEVTGNDLVDSEWAITGGTRDFTQASGNIKKKTIQDANGTRVVEVTIRGFYTPSEIFWG